MIISQEPKHYPSGSSNKPPLAASLTLRVMIISQEPKHYPSGSSNKPPLAASLTLRVMMKTIVALSNIR
jgi:hypothetical protein